MEAYIEKYPTTSYYLNIIQKVNLVVITSFFLSLSCYYF